MKMIEAKKGKIYYDGAEVLNLRFEEHEDSTTYYVRVMKIGASQESEWEITLDEFNRFSILGVVVFGE